MILDNIEDLNCHKNLLKRVQVLLSYINDLTKYLLKDSKSKRSGFLGSFGAKSSAVKVLTSVSRITIAKETPKANRTGKSFRNASFNSKASKRPLKPVANDTLGLLEDLAKSRIVPFNSRKSINESKATLGAPLAVPEDFNLSQILNQLTTLSHELSKSLEKSKSGGQVAVPQRPTPKPAGSRSPLKPVNRQNQTKNTVYKKDLLNYEKPKSLRPKNEKDKYKTKVTEFISEKDRMKELEDMDKKISELLKP